MRAILVFAGLALGTAGLVGNWLDRSSVATTPAAAKKPDSKVAAVAPPPSNNGARVVTIGRDHRGHFKANGRVDGRSVSFMVDTGASVIALTEREADRLGIRPMRGAYT